MMSKIIRGLSLTRPWPWAFLHGKRVENRSWEPPQYMIGQLIALHAANSWDEDGRAFISDVLGGYVPNKKESPRKEIFAVAKLKAVIESENSPLLPVNQRVWFFGPYVWIFDEFVHIVPHVPCVGAQGLWRLDDNPDVLDRVRQSYKCGLAIHGMSPTP